MSHNMNNGKISKSFNTNKNVSSSKNESINVKPKKTKSRNGCVTCKKRRLKCDETKPLCQNCIKRGIVCGGYAINFKWRDFSESSIPQKINTLNPIEIPIQQQQQQQQQQQHQQQHLLQLQRQQPQLQPKEYKNQSQHSNVIQNLAPISEKTDHLKKALEDATLSVTGRSTQEIAIANVLIANGKNPELAAAIASTLADLADNENIQQLLSQKQSKLFETITQPNKVNEIKNIQSDNNNPNNNNNLNINKSEEQEDHDQEEEGEVNNDNDNDNENDNNKNNNDNKGSYQQLENYDKSVNIQPKKLLITDNNNLKNKSTNDSNQNSSLNSLADVASRVPPSPLIPLSPFNEPFPFESFLQKNKIKKSTTSAPLSQQSVSSFVKTPNTLPPTVKKESPLNLFKDSPQPINTLSPIFPKSPNISGFLLSYQNNFNHQTLNNNFDGQNSNVPTPRFIDDMESGFHQYAKFSPINSESINIDHNNNTNNINNKNNTNNNITTTTSNDSNFNNNQHRLPLPINQATPPFYNMASIMNNNDSSVTTMTQFSSLTSGSTEIHQINSTSPIFEIETPRIINQNIPASPYSTLLNFATAIAPESNSLKATKKYNDDKIIEHDDENEIINNNLNKNYKSSSLIHRNSFSSIHSNNNSEPNSPKSIASDLSSTLDILEHSNRPQFILPENPINLYSLHLPDDHLTTLLAFDQHTCGIMSIKNGPTENPWRTFLLPMSVDHPVVRSALLAMTCFHVARGDPNLRARGVKYMKDAIVSLVHGLSSDNKKITDISKSSSSNEIVKKTPPDVALATCIALAMGEAWDRHISTGIAHLKGAKSMIVKVLNKLEGKKRMKRKRSYSTSSSTLSEITSTTILPDIENSLKNNNCDNENNINIKNNNGNNNNNNSDNDADNDHLNNKKVPKELQFLFNAWMYFDVLARMTSENEEYDSGKDEDDEGEDEDDENENAIDDNDSINNESHHQFKNNFKGSDNEYINEINSIPLKRRSSSNLSLSKRAKLQSKKKKNKETDSASVISKFRSFNLEDGDTIDPLLGVAQSLFPIMGEVATLITQVRRYKLKNKNKNNIPVKTPLRLISRTVELKSEIEHWKIPSLQNAKYKKQAEDPTFDLNAAVATAEAYRYSTLLYLHQTVPEVPSATSHSLAENVMMLLASVPSSSRTRVTHMFPLFAASCEARPGEEREWAKETWVELIDKMWIGTIERAWEVVKEVWARKDALSGKKRSKIFTEKSNNSNDVAGSNNEENQEFEYNKVKRRISMVIHGNDDDLLDDEDNNVGSWTHWTTIMKEWGWEVLLA